MEINYLHEFVVLADVCNFQRAADMLYTTQSSLSRHIKTLEKELGVILFNRTTHKTQLTDYGRLFYPYAKDIAKKQYQYQAALKIKLEKDSSVLNIGICTALPVFFISDIYNKIQETYPTIKINIFEEESQPLLTKLRDKTCDIALIREQPASDDIISTPLYLDPLVAVLLPGHPLASLEVIQIDQLRTERLLFLTRESHIYDDFFFTCKARNFTPDAMFKLSRDDNIIFMVKQSAGIAVLPSLHTKLYDMEGVLIREINPQISTTVNCVYCQNVKDNPLIIRGLNCIKKINWKV
ncbi:MAG: LysR family transcriptional regulator [Lachnospiraceae bacterium]|nr:LysR family transcriptional regulator [Lachnospiraceae bacterium]